MSKFNTEYHAKIRKIRVHINAINAEVFQTEVEIKLSRSECFQFDNFLAVNDAVNS